MMALCTVPFPPAKDDHLRDLSSFPARNRLLHADMISDHALLRTLTPPFNQGSPRWPSLEHARSTLHTPLHASPQEHDSHGTQG